MIDLQAALTVAHVALDVIRFPTDAHWPAALDMEQVRHYTTLLEREPSQDTDPIILAPCGDGYTITNGRHRFIAHCIAGRRTIAAVIVTPHSEKNAMTDLTCHACHAPLVVRLKETHWQCAACDAPICPACGMLIDGDDFLCAVCRALVDDQRDQQRLQSANDA